MNLLASQPCEVKLDNGKSSVQIRIEVNYSKRIDSTIDRKNHTNIDAFVNCEAAFRNAACLKGFKISWQKGIGYVLQYNEKIIGILNLKSLSLFKDVLVFISRTNLYAIALNSMISMKEEHYSGEYNEIDLIKYDTQPLEMPIKEFGAFCRVGSKIIASGTEKMFYSLDEQDITQLAFLVSPSKLIINTITFPIATISTFIMNFHSFTLRGVSCILGITAVCRSSILAVDRDRLYLLTSPLSDYAMFDRLFSYDASLDFTLWMNQRAGRDRYAVDLCYT